VNCDDVSVSFWRPAENPGARPHRSWVFDLACAIAAGAASLARFSFGQAARPGHLSLAAGALVAVATAAALPLRRVWPGPVFAWTLLAAAVLAQWPDRGALFPVALAISLYTVAAMMRRAAALAAAVLTVAVMVAVVAQDGTRQWAVAISDAAGFAAAVVVVGLYAGTRRAYLAALRDLDGLLGGVRAAGLPVRYDVTGTGADLPPAFQLAVFRLVQEALTNTMKHAGPGASATVRLRFTPAEVRVDVEDDGTPRGAGPAAGGGLTGMRERISAFGGELDFGPRQPRGWRVTARLGLDQPAAS
jgi:hypothetical protein